MPPEPLDLRAVEARLRQQNLYGDVEAREVIVALLAYSRALRAALTALVEW